MGNLQSFWDQLDANSMSQINSVAEGYLDLLKKVKTEWELKDYFMRKLLNFRFIELSKILRPLNGTGFFIDLDDDCFAAGVLGRDDIEKRGLSIIACPIDTGSIELTSKTAGVIPDLNLTTLRFKSKHDFDWSEWSHANVSLHGMSKFSDGSRRSFVLGESGRDPSYFLLKGEEKTASRSKRTDSSYDLVIGVSKEEKSQQKKSGLPSSFMESLGMGEKEFNAARVAVVPSSLPVEVGSDRSIIQGYGSSDLLPAYSALRTLIDLSMPEDNVVAVFYVRRGSSKVHTSQIIERTVESVVKKLKGEKASELTGDILEFSRILNVSGVAVKQKKSQSTEAMVKPVPFARGSLLGTDDAPTKVSKSNRLLGIIQEKLEKARVPYQTLLKDHEFDTVGTVGSTHSKKVEESMNIFTPSINWQHLEPAVSKLDIWATYRAMLCFSTY